MENKNKRNYSIFVLEQALKTPRNLIPDMFLNENISNKADYPIKSKKDWNHEKNRNKTIERIKKIFFQLKNNGIKDHNKKEMRMDLALRALALRLIDIEGYVNTRSNADHRSFKVFQVMLDDIYSELSGANISPWRIKKNALSFIKACSNEKNKVADLVNHLQGITGVDIAPILDTNWQADTLPKGSACIQSLD